MDPSQLSSPTHFEGKSTVCLSSLTRFEGKSTRPSLASKGNPGMAARQVATATMPWAHPDFGGEVMHLKLAPGTVSGFKGVHKAAKKWEARRWVAGRGTRVVWRSSSPLRFQAANFYRFTTCSTFFASARPPSAPHTYAAHVYAHAGRWRRSQASLTQNPRRRSPCPRSCRGCLGAHLPSPCWRAGPLARGRAPCHARQAA